MAMHQIHKALLDDTVRQILAEQDRLDRRRRYWMLATGVLCLVALLGMGVYLAWGGNA